jgi:hypothetical protein
LEKLIWQHFLGKLSLAHHWQRVHDLHLYRLAMPRSLEIAKKNPASHSHCLQYAPPPVRTLKVLLFHLKTLLQSPTLAPQNTEHSKYSQSFL